MGIDQTNLPPGDTVGALKKPGARLRHGTLAERPQIAASILIVAVSGGSSRVTGGVDNGGVFPLRGRTGSRKSVLRQLRPAG